MEKNLSDLTSRFHIVDTHLRLACDVTEARWNERAKEWLVRVKEESEHSSVITEYTCKVLISTIRHDATVSYATADTLSRS